MKKFKIQTIERINKFNEKAGHDPDYLTTSCMCMEKKCGWSGIMKDCDVRYESESWENPHEYEVLTCPKCGNDVDY